MIYIARLLSAIFRPSFYPTLGFLILFTMTYMNLMPWEFKLWVLSAVYIFTIALPYLLIFITRKFNGWTKKDMYMQHRRYIVYSINIICYICCMHVCQNLYLPSFMGAILVVSLMVQCVCVLTNIWYKVSRHSAGTGLIIGALMAYSSIFGFNPTWWLCAAILLSGAVMSSRMYLRNSSLGQVLSGTLVGIICGWLGISIW